MNVFCIGGYFETLQILMGESAKSPSLDLPSNREYNQEIMKTLYRLDEIGNEGRTNLAEFLCAMPYAYDLSYAMDLLDMFAVAAVEQDRVDWLKSMYRETITHADASKQAVIAAHLNISLAMLYVKYGDEQAKGTKMLESIGMGAISSRGSDALMNEAREVTLNQLGRYYICRALEDEHRAEKYVVDMERIVFDRRNGRKLDTGEFIPPNDVALYSASWYHRMGRDTEAHEILRIHLQDGIMILSDDDPSNDFEGFWRLKQVFIALGDDRNALAVLHILREFENGMAVIKEAREYDQVSVFILLRTLDEAHLYVAGHS